MIKKTFATVAVAASVVGAAGAATPALAQEGNDVGANTINGNGADQAYGNTTTGGYMSPNISLINGSLNKPCIPIPADIEAQNIVQVLAIPIGVQDFLNSKPQQQCTENSTLTDGDDALSGLLEDLEILSENGLSKN